MASILKSLWNRLAGASAAAAPALEAVEYNGYRIRPTPYQAPGGYQTCGVIEKEAPDGGVKEHRFVRAETHPTVDDAAAFTIAKGKQIIDQNGDRIFAARPGEHA